MKNQHERAAVLLRNGGYNARLIFNKEMGDYEVQIKGLPTAKFNEAVSYLWSAIDNTLNFVQK